MIKEIPPESLKDSKDLVDLTLNVLNEGLRPHLTKWQAKFRKWYEKAKTCEDFVSATPQELQRCYAQYSELEKDLIATNKQIIEYKALLKRIAFKETI